MIARLPTPVSTRAPHGETNAFLAGTPAVLLDPASASPSIENALSDRPVEHITVTHTHPDHVGGVAHYASETNATIWCRYGREAAFEAATGVAPDRTFRDGTELGDSGVVAMAVPGHAPDHTAFLVDGDAIVGDLLCADSSVFVGTPGGDMRAYFSSLRRLLARDVETLHPAHGDPVSDPQQRIREVLAHRQDRERRIESAVRDTGATSVEDILDVAYDKDLTGLRDLAARTVRAHLEKLAVEDRLQWDDETASAPNEGARNE